MNLPACCRTYSSARRVLSRLPMRSGQRSSARPIKPKAADEQSQYPQGRQPHPAHRAGTASGVAAIRCQATSLQPKGAFPLKATNHVVVSFAAAGLLVALVVPVSLWGFKQLRTAAEQRQHTFELIIGANALLTNVINAETGERGYALTGDEAFLEPY